MAKGRIKIVNRIEQFKYYALLTQSEKDELARWFGEKKIFVIKVSDYIDSIKESVSNISILPPTAHTQTENALHDLLDNYESIIHYSPDPSNQHPANLPQNLISNLISSHEQVYSNNVLSALALQKKEDSSELIDIVKFAKEKTKEIKDSKEQFDKILNQAKENAGSISALNQAVNFDISLKYHLFQKKLWLLALISCVVIGCFIFYHYFNSNGTISYHNNPMNLLYKLGPKLFFLSIFYISISFCLKNYSTHNHNAIINKHRSDSLKTYPLLIHAATGSTYDVILRQAAEAIFSFQNSGVYNKGASGLPASRFTEIISKQAGNLDTN